MFVEKVIGDLGDKRRWRQYRARVRQLPQSHRAAVEAFERYQTSSGPGGGVPMFEDLAHLFEQSAADRTPLREVVGEGPVEFIETFAQNYGEDSWRNRERERLINASERATGREIRAVR
ncbi:DUF1048 domain-containing protein [Nocardia pseudovaccinii]|uniref:DUF1048 domain-containing protein n=1 Tax=Nocardia pseudovaccinii TaxID=189540 RepID=UPI003D917D5C